MDVYPAEKWEHTPFISGTSMTMCPDSEMKMRERRRLLHKFEIIEGTSHYKYPRVNRNRAVKEYRRTAAGREESLASDLRPSPVLLKTVIYLIDSICSKLESNLERSSVSEAAVVYGFVFDRLRAVRQDIVVQNLHCSAIVQIFECCVRFHIYFRYVLCEADAKDFEQKFNETHTQECLKRLLYLYQDETNCNCNRREFLALYVLFNLGNCDALQLALESRLQQKCDETKHIPGVVHSMEKLNISSSSHKDDLDIALNLSLAWMSRNYIRVFKLAKKLSPLALCTLHRHFNNIRSSALKVISCGFSSKNLCYSVQDLSAQLMLDDEAECMELCEKSGQKLENGTGVLFNKSSFIECTIKKTKSRFINDCLAGVNISSLLKGPTCSCFVKE